MTLLRAVLTAARITGIPRRRDHARPRAWVRRAWRRGRGLAATGLGPVLVAGTLVVPAAVAVSVVTAAPARAAGGPLVLVLLQNGTTAPESTLLQNAGYTVTQATPSAWAGMSASQFESYAALVTGDPSSGGSCSTSIVTTATLGTAWQGAVSGNLAVLGTAPALPGTTAAGTLITDAAGYAAAGFNPAQSGTPTSGTGLYVSLNCAYSAAAAGTAVPLLAGVENIGTAGGLTVQGGLSCSDAGTVNTWEADKAGTFGGFTSSSLAASQWSPGCPVQEAFDSWPALFTPARLRRGRGRGGRVHRLGRGDGPAVRAAGRAGVGGHRGAGPLSRRGSAGRHHRRRHLEPGRSRRAAGLGRGSGQHRERRLHPVEHGSFDPRLRPGARLLPHL